MVKTRRQAEIEIKDFIKETEKLGIKCEKVILYGSFAKNRQTEDSDIDLIVVSQDFKNLNILKRLEILGTAAARVFKPIQAMGYTSEEIRKRDEISILNEAIKTGIAIAS
jgi:hypothetical protein